MSVLDDRERLIEDIAEWEAALQAEQWESAEEERMAVTDLLVDRERLAFLEGRAEDPEADRLRERLKEIEEEIEEEGREAEQWGESVEIRVSPISSDVLEKAARYFGSPQGYRGLMAYCRHRLTNYDVILKEMESARDSEASIQAYVILKERVDGAVQRALDEIGITPRCFYEPED